jgi:hypothetical protein
MHKYSAKLIMITCNLFSFEKQAIQNKTKQNKTEQTTQNKTSHGGPKCKQAMWILSISDCIDDLYLISRYFQQH